jgi:CubicO group peptidase (beta-lactamase class C family)
VRIYVQHTDSSPPFFWPNGTRRQATETLPGIHGEGPRTSDWPLGPRSLTPAEHAALRGYDEHGALVTVPLEAMPAAAGLKSTVADLLKYLQWHLAERDRAATLTHQPAWKLEERYSLGLNWQMFSLPGYRCVWQEGSIPGFSSYCVFCPELNLAVVALVNQLDRSSSDRVSTMVKQIVKDVDSRAANLP